MFSCIRLNFPGSVGVCYTVCIYVTTSLGRVGCNQIIRLFTPLSIWDGCFTLGRRLDIQLSYIRGVLIFYLYWLCFYTVKSGLSELQYASDYKRPVITREMSLESCLTLLRGP